MTIQKPDGRIWFLSSCVELYKEEKEISGKEAFNHLKKNGAVDFIVSCWEGLHTTSPAYILSAIEEYIENNSENQ